MFNEKLAPLLIQHLDHSLRKPSSGHLNHRCTYLPSRAEAKPPSGALLIKPERTFNETIDRLLGHGKPAWPKVIVQKIQAFFYPTDKRFLGLFFQP